jgi:glycosyltransferase involved in cell wall biosynthesis
VRIALVAPPWIPVPPRGYGGIEWVVHLLAERLVATGHEVTLYATGDSRTSAELVSFLPHAEPGRMHDQGIDAHHTGRVFKDIRSRAARGEGPDVVHDHSEWLGPAFAHTLPMPVVFTHHNPLTDERRGVYDSFFDDVTHVCLSQHQRSTWSRLAGCSVVPNAIDVSSYDVRAGKEDFLLCVSRIHPDKGNHLALEAGRRTGREVVLVVKIDAGEGER